MSVCSKGIECGMNREDREEYVEITFLIDGVNLIDLAGEFETPQAANDGQADLAGTYRSNYAQIYTEDFLLGRSGAQYGENGDKTEIVGCNCGCCGCWPLAAKISVKNGTVIWDHFEQPHRQLWSYKGFGPFVFELEQYRKEIGKIGAFLATRPSSAGSTEII